MQTFELPDVALMQLIQDYSRPVGRRDWRTCKRREAECIEQDTRELLDICIAHVEESDFMITLKLDMQKWTHYGRIRILRRPPPWDGVLECCYAKRCMALHGDIEPDPSDNAAFDAYYANMHSPYDPEPSEYVPDMSD